MSHESEEEHNRPLKVLKNWATSKDGWNLYERSTEEFQDGQSVEQLTLTIAALMNYRRLHPDFWDCSNLPITGSYIADLDALLQGEKLGNSGRVAEQMVYALMRNLLPLWEEHQNLILFLDNTLGRDRERPPLHVLDGFCDKYLRLRMYDGLLHGPTIMKLAWVRLPELREKNDNKIDTTQSEELSIQKLQIQDSSEYDRRIRRNAFSPSDVVAAPSSGDSINPSPTFRADRYTLIRLSNTGDSNVPDLLDTNLGLYEAPHVEELSDGSWEICVLESSILTIRDMLQKILPQSNVDIHYNHLEPTAKDLRHWDYSKARKLRWIWFEKRVIRIRKEGWPAAANHYNQLLLEGMFGSDMLLVPTYRGYLQTKEDAADLVDACIHGILAHARQGPRDREATISGNIFVWEANSTGIHHWRDGMEWNVREEGDFEVSEATDGSGLMRKTTSVRDCGATHHVVSYYTVQDASTLARPSLS